MADWKQLYDAIVEGEADVAKSVVEDALSQGVQPKDLLDNYMVPAMDEVGQRFERNEYFVPELLISARAMKRALEILKPMLAQTGAEPIGKVAIGTVKGDLHDIGKNLVAAMLEGGGFDVFDLGVDVGPERFIEAVQAHGVSIVALSALLTTTMPSMEKTIHALRDAGLRDRVKVMIGGAPVTQKFADQIGADGYSENAGKAVAVARQFVHA